MYLMGTQIRSAMPGGSQFAVLCQHDPAVVFLGNDATGRLDVVCLSGWTSRVGLVELLHGYFPDEVVIGPARNKKSLRPIVCVVGIRDTKMEFVLVGTCNPWLLNCALPPPENLSDAERSASGFTAKLTNRCGSEPLGLHVEAGVKCWFVQD